MELKEILKDCFNMKSEEFQIDQSLMQLEDWDSMNHMLFITRLEEGYNIDLTGDEIITLQTIGDVKQILQKKGIIEGI